MLGTTTVFLALILGLLLIHFVKLCIWAAKLPPGPVPLPIIGNLWTLRFELHPRTLMKLAKTYGNVMTIWVGQAPIVILTGSESVREGLVTNSEQLSGRPLTPFLNFYSEGNGIIVSNGENWKQQRRVGLQILRNLGLGKKSLEWKIQGEANRLVDVFTSKKGSPFDPRLFIINAVNSVISSVIFGHNFSLDDQTFHHLTESSDSVSNFYGSSWGQLYDAFPWLMRHLPGPHQDAMRHLHFLMDFLMQEIRQHQQNPSTEPQDFIDYYLNPISKNKDDRSSMLDERNLQQILLDFFLAGSETVASTLRWGLLYMALYPEIQAKVQQEVDAFLEKSLTVQYDNRKDLPYTYAVIHEIQRNSSVVPFGLPRQITEDIKLQGYQIKKGTVVVTSLASALHDPNIWKSHETFYPSNFLDNNGNFQCNDAFLPFSAGHRVCLGEQMAKMELFIFFTSLMYAFNFCFSQGSKVNTNGILGTTFTPHPYQICAIPR
ncbi:cytochrome P450 2J5-like [Spea bombifrons]|uniref:cytochrome P450 2J5-like n=1 Tax=Spea bombifrons TaxID=233779 RepID=UPI00234A1FFB|nr:cytochrome P450 2J5-like [Spea bombifrons]